MAKIKGSFSRIIKSPENHIVAQYDMRMTRKRKIEKRQAGNGQHVLPLTSMIDMFSMLVIFLLLNFSSTGEIFFINKKMKLPEAVHARPLETKPLISISDNKVFFDAKTVGQNPITLEETDLNNMPQLREALRKVKSLNLATRPNQEFKGEVNVQSDEKTPIVYIKRVMNVLISEGWSGINFATRAVGSSNNDSLTDEKSL